MKYRLTKNPQKALKTLLITGKQYGSNGLINKLINKLIQKLEHSWHNNGLFMYGSLATLLRMGRLASVSLHPYDTPKQHIK